VREKERKVVVIRFTFDDQRVRTGQAYLDFAYTKEGTPILIHQGGKPCGSMKTISKFMPKYWTSHIIS
jgi:hypothetical protein